MKFATKNHRHSDHTMRQRPRCNSDRLHHMHTLLWDWLAHSNQSAFGLGPRRSPDVSPGQFESSGCPRYASVGWSRRPCHAAHMARSAAVQLPPGHGVWSSANRLGAPGGHDVALNMLHVGGIGLAQRNGCVTLHSGLLKFARDVKLDKGVAA